MTIDCFQDGYYSIFFAGKEDQGFGLLVFHDGIISGVDFTGVKFDGEYKISNDGALSGHVNVEVPSNTSTVQGIFSGVDGVKYDMPLSLPPTIDNKNFFRIETPMGPVNVRFVFLRKWNSNNVA